MFIYTLGDVFGIAVGIGFAVGILISLAFNALRRKE